MVKLGPPQLVRKEFASQTGQEFNIRLDSRELPTFKKMFDEEGEFRDKFITGRVAETARTHDRVMVVMGSSHAIAEREALTQFFGSTEADKQTPMAA